MRVFNVIKVINIVYVLGIFSIVLYNNVIHVNPNSNLQDRLIIIFAVLLISIPNVLSIRAATPGLRLAKTTITLNLLCIILFMAGVVSHEQEPLAIWWRAAVVLVCAINFIALLSELLGVHESRLNNAA